MANTAVLQLPIMPKAKSFSGLIKDGKYRFSIAGDVSQAPRRLIQTLTLAGQLSLRLSSRPTLRHSRQTSRDPVEDHRAHAEGSIVCSLRAC
jgi:hypothetical protein